MEMSELADLAYTRVIVTHTLRELRRPVRRTHLTQRMRRLTGRAFFRVAQESTKPTEVDLADIGITPLWETNGQPARRATLGQTWTITHDRGDTTVVLVIDRDATAWLITSARDRHPATPDGWRHLLKVVAPNATTDATRRRTRQD